MSQKQNSTCNVSKSNTRDCRLPVAAMSCGNGCNLPISQKVAGRIRTDFCPRYRPSTGST